jgi:hypothetical protein
MNSIRIKLGHPMIVGDIKSQLMTQILAAPLLSGKKELHQ